MVTRSTAAPRVAVVEIGETSASAMNRDVRPGEASPLRPVELAIELGALGLAATYVAGDAPYRWSTDIADALVVVAAEVAATDALEVGARARSIVVDDVDRHMAQARLVASGLLGLITASGWTSWSYGMYGAPGFYGHDHIAAAAGLVRHPGTGALRPTTGVVQLPELIARYLLAAAAVGALASA